MATLAEVTKRVFGITDEGVDVDHVMDLCDSALSVAFDIATVLYSPFEGAFPNEGMTPNDAVERVLFEVLDAAPVYPEWARIGASEGAHVEVCNFLVSLLVDDLLDIAQALGWCDIYESDVDDIISAGQDVLRSLIAARGVDSVTDC